jgi:hypothetical protein
MQAERPVRTAFARLLLLWLIGMLGIAILYLLIARVMMPTLQEEMASTQVFAYRGWQSTGIRLEPGETAMIRAKGDWLYTPGEWHDANGHERFPAPYFYPMTGVAGGVLLGRIGESGVIYQVGTRGYIYSDESGMLYLRINDDILSDNEGALQVTVEIIPAPEP